MSPWNPQDYDDDDMGIYPPEKPDRSVWYVLAAFLFIVACWNVGQELFK